MERGRAPVEDDDVVRLVVVPDPRGRPGEGENEHEQCGGHHISVEQEILWANDAIRNTSRAYSDGR